MIVCVLPPAFDIVLKAVELKPYWNIWMKLKIAHWIGHLYVKSDVYGFGVVLVEILTGLRALDQNRPSGQQNLVEWIKPHLAERRKLTKIMDSRLEGKYPSKSVFRIAQLALKCIGLEPKQRPSMKEVVETLERIEAAKERPMETRTRSNHSTSHRHRQQSFQHQSPHHLRNDGSQAHHSPQRRQHWCNCFHWVQMAAFGLVIFY